MTQQMQALVMHRYGDEDVLQVAQMPLPEPGPGEVRIRVRAAAVNPVDLVVRDGTFLAIGALASETFPMGLGFDVAGEIDAIGPRTGRLAPGDRVIALADALDMRTGGQAEFVVLPETSVARAPRDIELSAAATLPLNGLTAWQALDRLSLPDGGTILVTGAAGGLGGLSVELAALRGLRVIAQAADADQAVVDGLGAHHVVDRAHDLALVVRRLVPGGVDGAIDAACLGMAALDAVRSGGSLVAVRPAAAPMPLRDIAVHQVQVGADAGQLAALSLLAEAGRLTLRVAEVLPLTRAGEAHRRLAAGGTRGRLVLAP